MHKYLDWMIEIMKSRAPNESPKWDDRVSRMLRDNTKSDDIRSIDKQQNISTKI